MFAPTRPKSRAAATGEGWPSSRAAAAPLPRCRHRTMRQLTKVRAPEIDGGRPNWRGTRAPRARALTSRRRGVVAKSAACLTTRARWRGFCPRSARSLPVSVGFIWQLLRVGGLSLSWISAALGALAALPHCLVPRLMRWRQARRGLRRCGLLCRRWRPPHQALCPSRCGTTSTGRAITRALWRATAAGCSPSRTADSCLPAFLATS